MKKHDNWPRLLNEFIDSRRDAAFAWGWNDCCLFACDGVLKMTDIDLAEGIRGRYRTKRGAARVIKQYGSIEKICESITAKYRLVEVPVALAQRGAIMIYHGDEGHTVGLCSGTLVAVPTLTKLEFRPISACYRAWNI